MIYFFQIKWGGLLVKILLEQENRLSLGVHWRPPYDTLMRTHFKRLSFTIYIFLHNFERIMKIVTNCHVCFRNMANDLETKAATP
jgi:hypothetical protein